ncbi:FAD-dependent oxidoreductase [Bradyrhizobium ottawaense]|uniref:NAD(P)/FAD-dependent oxidoreductase n=1 Tax=Bradyrhizobium ottawaense TaxID=931866 RepID=UPI000BE96EAF|nr:FAD-binding oxidoreductase [Bradyrhizobium ottawaense]PDT63971.1 FAD-dependent oxidoreductase [Bradyrhizobium ottawaense]
MSKDKVAPRYAAKCGWNALLPRRTPREQAPNERRFYAIVVGAGYTGLGAARRLAELMPEKEILVLESSEIGEGSSARNSGFLSVNPVQPRANSHGSADDDAIRKVRIVVAGLDWLRTIVKENNIDCDWDEKAPRVTAAATPEGEILARRTKNSLERWTIKCAEHDAGDLEQLLGTNYYLYGYEPLTRALVQPAALIRGIADTLPANVTLLEKTPVEAVSGSGPFHVQTRRGDFSADKVFIANNAHARALGFVTNRMIGVYTYGALTPVLDDDELARFGKLPAWGVIPKSKAGTTMRKVQRRFLIRSSASYERETDPQKVRSILTQLFRNRYPKMHSYEFEHVWGGLTAITSNGENYFGELKPGLYASVGCQGAGVCRAMIHGKLLAEFACGSQSSLLADRLTLEAPNWIPPEPFRGIGALTRMSYMRWRAGRDY